MDNIDFTPNRTCERCSNTFFSLEYNSLCMDCTSEDLFERLSINVKEEIDQLIYGHYILHGVKIAKDNLPISLYRAVEVIKWRHRELLKTTPDKFNCTYEEYWQNIMTL